MTAPQSDGAWRSRPGLLYVGAILLAVACGFALGRISPRAPVRSGEYPQTVEVWHPPGPRAPTPRIVIHDVHRIDDQGELIDLAEGEECKQVWKIVLISGDRRVSLYTHTAE